jgi:alpha-1,2-mannosyltransferase
VSLAVLALAGSIGAIVGAWRALAGCATEEKPGVIVCGLAISVAAWTIGYLHTPSDDYRLYELAARQWVAGDSLYSVQGHNQLPLPLLSIASLRLTVGWFTPFLDADAIWRVTYYAYELLQLLSIMAIIGGSYALAVAAGAPAARAGLIAGVAVALTFPIRESLGNNQMNLPVLALALPALALAARRPWMAGAFLTIGGALKLYPLALTLRWIVERRWRPLGAAFLMAALLVAGLWPHWLGFFAFAAGHEPAAAYRHAGLHAVIMNSTRAILDAAGTTSWQAVANIAWLLSVLAVVAWAVWISLVDHRKPEGERRSLETSARVMAAVLLIFPLTWAHHYVFAIPLAVCLWARGTPRPRHALATALVLFVPAFDIYPLGLHRLVGLFLLLAR